MWAQRALGDLLAHLAHVDHRIDEYDTHLRLAAHDDPRAQRLMKLRGGGPIGASAIVATVGTAHEFRSGRQFAAWLGWCRVSTAPAASNAGSHHTKAGDTYLRTLPSWGRERCSQQRPAERIISRWALALQARRGYMRAVVAIAAKNARLAWAMLRRGEDLRMSEVTAVY